MRRVLLDISKVNRKSHRFLQEPTIEHIISNEVTVNGVHLGAKMLISQLHSRTSIMQ